MDAKFDFVIDPTGDVIRVTLSGFFGVADVERFVAARDVTHRELTCPRNQHATLVDVRGMQIQSQDSVAEFQRMLANPKHAGRAIAFVVAQSLARLQAQRAAQGRCVAFFTSVEDAERWLRTQVALPA